MSARLDHLVVAAASLQEGVAWVEERLGLPPAGRGRHERMGTQNALWGLGEAYLEVIAVEPGGLRPDRPRWFGFDDPAVAARLRQGPALLTWAVAAAELAPLIEAAPVALEGPFDYARDDLRWQVALPREAALPLDGAWPLTICWTAGLHPARRLTDQGLRLRFLEVRSPEADRITAALGAVEGAVRITPASETALSAEIETPGGVVTL